MPSDNPLPRINKNYINLGVWFKQFDFCLVKEIYTLIYPVKGNTKHMDEWAQVSLTSFSGKVGAWIIISRIAGRHGPLLHQRKTRGSICRAESTTHCFPLLAAILKFTTQVYLTNSSNNSHSELLQHNIGFFMNLKFNLNATCVVGALQWGSTSAMLLVNESNWTPHILVREDFCACEWVPLIHALSSRFYDWTLRLV